MKEILNILNKYYPHDFDNIEFVRDGGSTSYNVFCGEHKYFLRIIKPAFFDTAISGINIQAFLFDEDFPVPQIIRTNDNALYVREKTNGEDQLYVLYEFIEGSEPNCEQHAEAIGELIGKLHHVMKNYDGELVRNDKHFFIGRYIDILRQKQYPKTHEFEKYSDILWDRIKDLPRGYCHGDMIDINMHRTPNGKLYLLDFDTSCEGFPLYDLALICNKTDYFNFDSSGYEETKTLIEKMMQSYLKYNNVSKEERAAIFDLIALYHFTLQATIIELHGIDCVNEKFLDNQLDWLYKWREQCENQRV